MTLTFETVNLSYILGIMDPYSYLELDCRKARASEGKEGYCPWTYSIFTYLSEKYNSKYSANISSKYKMSPLLKLEILILNIHFLAFSVVAILLFVLVGGIIEGYLFAMLQRGVREVLI